MAKQRDTAVGYTLPSPDDTNSHGNASAEETVQQDPKGSGLRNRGAEGRHGPFDESSLPSASSSSGDPQGNDKPEAVDTGASSSSSYVPKPSQDQIQMQIPDPSREHGFDRLIYEKVHEFPLGTPRLAAFIDSSDHNAVFRRFGRTAARVLIQRGMELTRLETKLDELDNSDKVDPILWKRLRGYVFDEDDGRQEKLLKSIEDKLCRYYKLLLYVKDVRALDRAPENHWEGLFTNIRNRHPLKDGADDFIYHVEDFVSVAKQSERSTRFTDLLETLLTKWPSRFGKWLFQSEKEREKIDDPYVEQYSPVKVRRVNKIIAVFLAICVLLIPVMLLFLRDSSKEAMAWLVFAFVLCFCVMVTVLTEARVLEIFVATAAYTAVLVTFLGNLSHS